MSPKGPKKPKMGRPPRTRQQLEDQVKYLRDKLRHLRNNPYPRLIDKKPDYHFSFTGFYIINKYRYYNGLTRVQLEILIVFSYYEYLFRPDMKHWNLSGRVHKEALEGLLKDGYLVQVEVPGKTRCRKRKALTLTKKGKDVEADYEKYYEQVITELMTRTNAALPNNKQRFEDGAYFRKIRISRWHRRQEQGGGRIIGRRLRDRFRDPEQIKEKVDGETEHREGDEGTTD
jgi:predicted transcriptional regulator